MADVVCTSAGCSQGRALVSQMWDTFNNLVATYPNFKADNFHASAQSIQDALDGAISWYSDWIPFNSSCCTAQDIGAQAAALTNQMLQSVGAPALPAPPAATDWGSVIVFVGVVAAVIYFGPEIKRALR